MSRIEVQAVRALCPKFDKYLLSKTKRPELYGVRLTEIAERAIAGIQRSRATEPIIRGKRYKVTVELSESEFRALQHHAKMERAKRSVYAKKTLLKAIDYTEQTMIGA